jgi:hypothetical protein
MAALGAADLTQVNLGGRVGAAEPQTEILMEARLRSPAEAAALR